ncbi:MAG: response regulator [Anaerolineae bacterium]
MNELQGKRIFIVEDDPTNMAINAVTLRRAGATVIQDFWNTDVLTHVQKAMPVDVILLDLMLRHDMNGYAIFEALQADPELATIPVIIVSAADPDIEIARAKSKGVQGFIGKPILPRLFAQQIASVLDGQSVWYALQGHATR